MTRLRLLPVVVLGWVLVAGCGVHTEPPAAAPQVSSVARTDLVLEPADGEPTLVLDGKVNAGRSLPVDLPALDALPNQTLTVVEPFLKKSKTFDGVRLTDLLDAARATGTSVTVHALDDYEVTFEAAVLRDQGALLATRVDGRPIDISDGGPVRLIFPASSKAGLDTDLWVWSIDQISFE